MKMMVPHDCHALLEKKTIVTIQGCICTHVATSNEQVGVNIKDKDKVVHVEKEKNEGHCFFFGLFSLSFFYK